LVNNSTYGEQYPYNGQPAEEIVIKEYDEPAYLSKMVTLE